jgi:hypothetical protein
LSQQRGYIERIAHRFNITSSGTCCGLHTFQCGRSHLSAGHSVYSVIYEDDHYVFAAITGVYGFTRADCRKVTVTLIGEDILVRQYPFYSGSHGTGPAVGCLNQIEFVKII